MVCNGTTNHPSEKGLLTPKIFRGNLPSEKVEEFISANFKSLDDSESF